jgi:hypothetical protein
MPKCSLQDRLLSRRFAVENTDDRAAVHHGNPIAHAEDLG